MFNDKIFTVQRPFEFKYFIRYSVEWFIFAQILSTFVAHFSEMSNNLTDASKENHYIWQLSNRVKKKQREKIYRFVVQSFNQHGQVPKFRQRCRATAYHAIAAWSAYGIACTVLEKYDRSKSTWNWRRWLFGKQFCGAHNLKHCALFVPSVMSSKSD